MSLHLLLVVVIPAIAGYRAARVGGPIRGTVIGFVLLHPLLFGFLFLDSLWPESAAPVAASDAVVAAREAIRGWAFWWLPSFLLGVGTGEAVNRVNRQMADQ